MDQPRVRQLGRGARIPGRSNGPSTSRYGRGYNRTSAPDIASETPTWYLYWYTPWDGTGNLQSPFWNADISTEVMLIGLRAGDDTYPFDISGYLAIGEQNFPLTIEAGQFGVISTPSVGISPPAKLVFVLNGPIPEPVNIEWQLHMYGVHDNVVL